MLSINNTTGLQAFQLIRYIALIGISILLANLGLSSEQIGVYETVIFISGLLTFFWVSGLIQAMLPLIKGDGNKVSPELFNTLLVLIIFSIITFIAGLLLEPIIRRFESINNFPYYKTALIYAVISAPGNLIEYIYLIKNKPKKIILYGTVAFSVQVLAVFFAIVFGFGVLGAVYCLIAIATVKLLFVLFLVFKHSSISISPSFIGHFLSLGLPLVGKFLVSGSASYIDGLIITSRFSLSSFVVFRYGARDFPLVTMMTNSLSNSMLPEFVQKQKLSQAMHLLKQRSRKLMHFLFPVTIVSVLLSKPLFPIVFNPDFADSANVFMVYLLTISSRIIFPQTVAIGLGKTKTLLGISFVELTLNVALSLLLVQKLGIVGVAWATVIAFWLEKVMIAIYLYFTLRIKPSQYVPIKQYILYSLLVIAVYFFAFYWI